MTERIRTTRTPLLTQVLIGFAVIIILPFAVILGCIGLLRYAFSCAAAYLWAVVKRKRGVIIFSDNETWGDWAANVAAECRLLPLRWEERAYWQSLLSLQSLLAFMSPQIPRDLRRANQRRMFPVALVCGRSIIPRLFDFRTAWQEASGGNRTGLKEQEALLRARCKR